MTKCLFGLRTMLVDAGLMFILVHGNVSSEEYNKVKCKIFRPDSRATTSYLLILKIKDLTFVSAVNERLRFVRS